MPKPSRRQITDEGRSFLREKIMARVEKIPEAGCWIFTGARHPYGYGVVRLGYPGTLYLAHRIMYGEVPGDLVLDHLCRVPACVNPDHLEAVTNGENLLRGTNPPAMNARKTTCPNGHPLIARPTQANGWRRCAIRCDATAYNRRKSAENRSRP